MSMPVSCSTRPGEAHLLHSGVQLAEMKTMSKGPIRSCRVQSRVNHSLRLNGESGISGPSESEASSGKVSSTSESEEVASWRVGKE